MFDDLLTSSRGPGVIGLLLGILVLAGFGALSSLVLTSDAQDFSVEVKENEATVKILEDKQRRWTDTAQAHSSRRKVAEQFTAVKGQLESKLALLSTVETEVAKQSSEFSALDQEFETYKRRYILSIRAQAVGEKLPTLTIKNGKTYEDVIIRRVSAEGMEIRHKNGGTLVTLKLMPDALLERFQFSNKDEELTRKMEAARTASEDKGEKAYNESLKVNALKTERNQLRFKVEQMIKSTADAEKTIISHQAAESKARKKADEYTAKEKRAKSLGRSSAHGTQIKKETDKANRYVKSISMLAKLIKSNGREIALSKRDIKELDKQILEMQSNQK